MRKQFYKTGEFNPLIQRIEIIQGLYLCWSLHIDEEGNSYLITTFEVIKLDNVNTAAVYEPETGNIIVIKKDDDIINESHHTLGKVVRVGDIISETTIKGFSEAFFNDDYQKVYKYLNEIIKQKG
jgi:hypothetical protein